MNFFEVKNSWLMMPLLVVLVQKDHFKFFIALTSVSGVLGLNCLLHRSMRVFELLKIFWWSSFDFVHFLSRLLSLFHLLVDSLLVNQKDCFFLFSIK